MAHQLQPECFVALGCREVNVAKEDRGFASMDRGKQREIASKGRQGGAPEGHRSRMDE
jgi:hypothetical protein